MLKISKKHRLLLDIRSGSLFMVKLMQLYKGNYMLSDNSHMTIAFSFSYSNFVRTLDYAKIY